MPYAKFTTSVDERRVLSFTLPTYIHAGEVEVVITQKAVDVPARKITDAEFNAHMDFHKGRSLGDLTVRELKEEGRR